MTTTAEKPTTPEGLVPPAAPFKDGLLIVDPERWPDVASQPIQSHRSVIARQLFRSGVTRLPIRVEVPGAKPLGSKDPHAPVMQLVRPSSFDRRVGGSGLIGFGESYMAGDWEADDLAKVLTAFAQRAAVFVPPALQRFRTLATRKQPASQEATKANSRQQISHHYDLSNDLFQLFLDEGLSYSSALFTLPKMATWADLHDAQLRKVDRLLDATNVGKGSRVLEIGSGWGELAIRAAQRGATVRTITLSAEQRELALERIEALSLSDRIEVVLEDYRDTTGEFDAIVSVEMIEAVGYAFWPTYFSQLDRLLAPGGRVGIQAITMPDDRLEASKHTFTWIQKYIFPGGLIPSVEAVHRCVDQSTDLEIIDEFAFGLHYAETLKLWRARFEENAGAVDALGFDAVFRRMWSLYLAYSEAGFRAGYLDVVQFTMQKKVSPVSAASKVAAVVEPFFGGEIPIRIRMWDGSETGTKGGPVLLIKSRKALRRVLWAEPELALAQAYVTGEIDVEGDLRDGLRQIWATARERGLTAPKPTPKQIVAAVVTAARLGAIGPKPKAPVSQAQLKGRMHSLLRDRAAIHHHYDLSNDFYQLILDPKMAYSSGYWTSDDPDYTLDDSQRDKLDLICRKLDMQPGGRHLDVGCGWGSLSLHAAEHYGVTVVGVTLAAEQKAFIDARIKEKGLEGKVEIRLQDYREVPDGPFDTITSIEMGEHVGSENYPVFTKQLHDLVKPGGRVCIQQMSRRDRPGGGPFIEAFIAPDMYMRPLGETVALFEDADLEVRDVQAMREHYVRTVDAWYDTFESNFPKAVEMVGEEVARVWRLYLVGGALSFEEGRMGVDQILSVRRLEDNRTSGMPSTAPWHGGFEQPELTSA